MQRHPTGIYVIISLLYTGTFKFQQSPNSNLNGYSEETPCFYSYPHKYFNVLQYILQYTESSLKKRTRLASISTRQKSLKWQRTRISPRDSSSLTDGIEIDPRKTEVGNAYCSERGSVVSGILQLLPTIYSRVQSNC